MIKLLSTRCEEPFGSCHPIMSSRLESNSEKRLQRVLGDCVKMIWTAQNFIKHSFIHQMTHGFKTWVIRRTEANHNAAMYKSLQLLAVFLYSESPPSRWGILESSEHNSIIYSLQRIFTRTMCTKNLRTYRLCAHDVMILWICCDTGRPLVTVY